MTRLLRQLLAEPDFAAEMTACGLETVRARHTCSHRVDELLAIVASYRPRSGARQIISEEVEV